MWQFWLGPLILRACGDGASQMNPDSAVELTDFVEQGVRLQ